MDSTHIAAYFVFILVSRCFCIVLSGACPTHFVNISSRCYYVSSMDVEGFEAYTLCDGLHSGATLAVFQTDAEKKNVAEGLSLTNGTRYLIGPHPACESGCYTIRPMANLETPLIGLISCETFLQFICEAPIIYDVPDEVTISTITSDSTSITALWSYSSSSTSYTGFRVTAAPSTGAQQSTVNVNSSELSATLSDLYSGTVYNVTVYVLFEDQISTGVSMDSFTYPGYVPCLLASNVDKEITISWSSAAGEVDGYRVWAYVTEKTQEDQETGDPTTLSHTFSGKNGKTYAIDIYSYVWVNGVQYWSFPIEADFHLDKDELNEVNVGSYPCTAVTPAPITTTSSPAANTTTYCPVVDIYTTTLPTTTDAPSTLQTTTEVTTTMTTTYPTTTAVQTTANPTSTAVKTTSPTTVAQTTTKPATTLLVTTDLTTLQTTHPPLTTPKTTSASTTDMQTTTNPTTSTPSPTTTFHSSTDPTTYPSTTLQTTTNPTTRIPTTLGFTTTAETSNALTSAPQTPSDSSDPQTTATQSSAAPSTVQTVTPLVETGIVTDILETTQETSSIETNVNTCNSSEGVLNSEDYIALIPNEKANFTQDVISDLIYFMNETRDEETVYSYMETAWPSLFGPNCQPIAPIRSKPTPFMIEVMGSTLMEHLLNVTNETLNLAFYDVGIVKEFRMIVNLAVNDSDVNMMFGERSDTYVEIPTAALRNGDCCKALMFIQYNEPPLDETKNLCADLDQRGQCEGNDILIGDFITLEIFPPNPDPFPAPVVFHFTPERVVAFPNETVCVWLDEEAINHDNNIWRTSGCVTINGTESGTRCECDHLTSFSILMKVTEYEIPEIHGKALSIITFIGCGVSIVCAVLIIILFLCFGLMKEERILHTMLLVAIAAGQLTFLVGIDRTENKVGCKVVAIVIQYFMTASFSWMLIESVYLYRHVVLVFSSRVNISYYVIAGWGVPVVLVVISLGISFDHIPSENFCWLSTAGGAIYAFVGPALAVIVINTILLGIVLREIRRIIDRDITKIEVSKAKTTAKTLLVFIPVMGVPWVFGVLAINGDTLIFDYLFTALTSFQGLMIFLIHTVGNREFRSKVSRKRRKVDPFSNSRGRTNPSSSGATSTTMIPMK